ncbi:hypothetical protein SAMN05216525_10369 [Bradyrhizobium sp. Gha]|nr:hypothetical protein SAMN05216525_10369 [Bradyrhizobium sp. Gha]
MRFLSLSLVGEGGSPRQRRDGEGSLSARENVTGEFSEATPHPALRATFSHKKGRRKKNLDYFAFLAFFAVAAFFAGFSFAGFSALTSTGVLATTRMARA